MLQESVVSVKFLSGGNGKGMTSAPGALNRRMRYMSGPAERLLQLQSGKSLLSALIFGCKSLTPCRFSASFSVDSSFGGNAARIFRLIAHSLPHSYKQFKIKLKLGGTPFLKGVLVNIGQWSNKHTIPPLGKRIQVNVGSRYSSVNF